VWQQVAHLKAWSRKDLIEAVADFRMLPGITVNLVEFRDVLKWLSRTLAEGAFVLWRPKDGKIDFMQVIGPMVFMSDEHFVSRASLLFSILDFNSSGTVNRAEFGIGLRSMILGFTRIARNFVAPPVNELEDMANAVFRQLDQDQSGFITMGEFIAYAYRSRDFRGLCSPFPSVQDSVMEEQVYFAGRKSTARVTSGLEKKLYNRLRITPDDEEQSAQRLHKAKEREKKRPWRIPAAITRTHAWLLLHVFNHMANDRRTIPAKDLLQRLGAHMQLKGDVDALVQRGFEDGRAPEDAWRVVRHFYGHLASDQTLERAQSLYDENCTSISLRAFCCILWPQLKEVDVERCMKWCKHMKASTALREVAKAVNDQDFVFDAEDIAEIFEVLDTDGDGNLSYDELCSQGFMDRALATRVVNRMDSDRSGFISKQEMGSLLQQLHDSVTQQLKLSFRLSMTTERNSQAEGAKAN